MRSAHLEGPRTVCGPVSQRQLPNWPRRVHYRQCCNFQVAAHKRHDAGVTSDCNLEQPRDEMELANNLTDAYPPGLPLPNRMHRFVTLDRAVGSPERAEALARSHPPLDGPMILLQDVIQVLHRPQSTSTPQRAF